MSKITIGSKVKTKGITSPAVTGTIVRIERADFHRMTLYKCGFETWFKHDKTWCNPDKLIYVIKKDFKSTPLFPKIAAKLAHALDKKPKDLYDNFNKTYCSYMASELELFNWIEDVEQRLE
jgi:hypothetical protein